MTNDTARLIAGAMSGTSADGVDVAITRVTGRGLDMKAELVRHHHRPYDAALRGAIFQLRDSGQTSLSDLARLAQEISLTYALTVNEALSGANLRASDLAAVAAHGQTLYHAPPNTIQWLDPALIAAEVGCPVVSDFRRADCASGGQGAPLVPFADYILFRHPQFSRALLNIGGIANVTLIHGTSPMDEMLAFDTGPGNCISDHLCRTRDPGGPGFDVGGQRAMRGHLIKPLAEGMLSHEYFKRLPPKSTDGPEMIRIFERALEAEKDGHTLDDLLFTACRITVQAITTGIKSAWGGMSDELVVSGGGTKNQLILEWLTDSSVRLLRTDDLGVPSDAKEAIAFALLAAATLDGVPSNVPSVTGARRAVVLGSITPRP